MRRFALPSGGAFSQMGGPVIRRNAPADSALSESLPDGPLSSTER
jgi:hypothetical protein